MVALLPKEYEIELIYRGSYHGFKAADFHNNCDDKGTTLTIIKSEHQKIFGGFTDIPWKSSGD